MHATDFEAAATEIGVASDIAARAARNAVAAPLLAMSGWLASGKDTIADLVYDELAPTIPDDLRVVKVSLATPLKAEVTSVMRTAAGAGAYRGAIADVANRFGVTRRAAEGTIDRLVGEHRSFADAVDDLSNLDAYSRTPEIRLALQYWGTDIRRAQDSSYWAKKAAVAAVESLADGEIAEVCDCRFPDEVIALQRIGYKVVRLEVSRETQAARLLARDGLVPDQTALRHASETALDDFAGFDLTIDNNGSPEPVVQIVRGLFG
jgi:hypothetical protein